MPTFCQGRSKIRPGQDAEGKNRSYCSPESKEANRGVNPRRKQPALISSSPRLAQDRPIEMAAKPETLTVRMHHGMAVETTQGTIPSRRYLNNETMVHTAVDDTILFG